MTQPQHSPGPLRIRPVRGADQPAIVAIDAYHSGAAKPAFWSEAVERVAGAGGGSVGFVAENGGEIVGYVFAEARAWEFGSPLCGWITAIGVHPDHARRGVAFALGGEVCAWLKGRGITTLRTMVRRDSVEVLSFFRAAGFRAGPYLELELEL